ncbi:MAG: hypothetical protein V1753_09000, partial [Pseudomonadota bacterium]
MEQEKIQDSQSQKDLMSDVDIKLIAKSLAEFNIARKNVAFYPKGHAQIAISVAKAFQMIQDILETCPNLTIAVAGKDLFLSDQQIEHSSQACNELAEALGRHNILAVTFQKGLVEEEFIQFHSMLAKEEEEIRGLGGIQTAIQQAGIIRIKVGLIDYSRLSITDEVKIVRGQQPDKSDDRTRELWRKFVAQTISGARPTGNREGYVDTSGLSKEEISAFLEIRELLKTLSPSLREQFLSTAVNRLSPDVSKASEAPGNDIISDMLKHKSDENKEISPALIRLAHKLSNINGRTDIKNSNILPEEAAAKLFEREKYESFVGADYDATLKKLINESTMTNHDIDTDIISQFDIKSMEEDSLDLPICRLLLAFLDDDIPDDSYKHFAERLIASVLALLKNGEFSFLTEIFKTFSRHCTQKDGKDIKKLAQKVRHAFESSEFIKTAMSAVYDETFTSNDKKRED